MLYLLSLCLDSLCLAYHSCSLSIVLTVRKKGPNRADPVPTKAPESCVAHASDYSIWQEVKALQSALESKIHSNLPACSCIDFLSPLRPCIAAQEKHGLRCSTKTLSPTPSIRNWLVCLPRRHPSHYCHSYAILSALPDTMHARRNVLSQYILRKTDWPE